jgi:hypothetical protein
MAREDEKSGILEVAAIIALLFFMWKMTHKKQVLNVQPVEPKVINVEEELDPPGFDLNTYCEKIVYRPLTSTNLAMDNLLPNNWCVRGDTDIVDKSKGFGDAYADKQAADYQDMKATESNLMASKNVIQFRLINDTNAPITTSVLNTTHDSTIFNVAPEAPVISGASEITDSAFTANWISVAGASGYYLDVATDNSFLSFVPGYQNLNVGNVTSLYISGLNSGTNYYCRIRSYNSSATSVNSGIASVKTKTIYNDWFLPSLNEIDIMISNLYAYGVGNMVAGNYWSSSEDNANNQLAFSCSTITNLPVGEYKSALFRVRACRSFITTSSLPLRSIGPAGGLIFYVLNNGGGTFTCYESAPNDQNAGYAWSNIINAFSGAQNQTIGYGIINTPLIIVQAGHITSAALLCKNLTIIN